MNKIEKRKDVWNFSPDSTLLGVTDFSMKILFSQSGQVFQQFWVFEAHGIFFLFLKTPFVPFIVLKTTVSIPRFQCKNRFEKRTTVGRDICKNVFKHGTPNQTATPFCFFSNISAQGGPFFKPIFALKPWD